jgi:class 3 adenylate cyclase
MSHAIGLGCPDQAPFGSDERGQSDGPDRAVGYGMVMSCSPRHRCIVAVDIEASTTRTNAAKAELRRAMYDLLEQALQGGGVSRRYRDRGIDRGDGVLTLVRPVDQVPKTLLLNPVIPLLADLLAGHDAEHPDQRFRMRAVVHAGEIHYDGRGVFGEALDLSFRLLDAPEVKRTLRGTSAPLVLVASDDIYRTVIRQGYDGIDQSAFAPLVRVAVAGRRHRGWVHVPPIA